jgi:hypothetical protein
MESCIEVIDLSSGDEVLVSTKDRYRIIVHKEDGDEIYGELLTLEEAHMICQPFNGLRCRQGDEWAEIIDYSEAYEREERERYREDVEEHAERLLERRAQQVEEMAS